MTLNQRIDYSTSTLMYKSIDKSNPNHLHNKFEYVKDKHQVDTTSAANGNCLYLSCLLRQDKDLSSTEEYMLGTVDLWKLESERLQARNVQKHVAGTVCN